MRIATYGIDHTPALIAVEAIPNQSAALAAYIAQWAIAVRNPRPIGSNEWKRRTAVEVELWKALTDAERHQVDVAYARGMGL